MPYHAFAPDLDLAPYLEQISIQESTEPGVTPTTILPTGTADILFHFGDPFVALLEDGDTPEPVAYITGQRTRPRRVTATGATGIVVVSLTPWGIGALSRCSAAEFTDTTMELGLLFSPGEIRRVMDGVMQASSPLARVHLVQRFLRSAFSVEAKDALVIDATTQIYASCQHGLPLTMTALSDSLGVSKRQLDRRFTRQVGLTPKSFQRIVRFQQSLATKNKACNLSAVATDASYFDESHLIHEQKRYAGVGGTRLMQQLGSTPLASYYEQPRNMSRFYNSLYL